MSQANRIAEWLERHCVTPAYSGWLLSSLAIFFFMAATNTLSGWLYVISGIGMALLTIAAILPERTLRSLQVQRRPIAPVSAGDLLTVEVILENPTPQSKGLIQITDLLPANLHPPLSQAIEMIAPKHFYRWLYTVPTQQRGIYRWQSIQLRTAAPLGLFWCRRLRSAKATAIVYPVVLPLAQCPLIDALGQDASSQRHRDRRTQTENEGLTRSMRPYRWGDPTRLIHWRTSARYGELRVRELEIFTGGQELIIALDSADPWTDLAPSNSRSIETNSFEQAVIAAASLYSYAEQTQLNARVWTAATGCIQGDQVVLETLAAVQPGEATPTEPLPPAPIIWLTANSDRLNTLPPGSRWLWWDRRSQIQPSRPSAAIDQKPNAARPPGIVIQPDQPLQPQLQQALETL
jgi:uncharacterized protein (DUF58 family)